MKTNFNLPTKMVLIDKDCRVVAIIDISSGNGVDISEKLKFAIKEDLTKDITYEIRIPKINVGEYDSWVEFDVETEDVDLEEFSDEIEHEIIEQLKSIGCDTAKSVLELSDEELERRTGLTVETINGVREVLSAEFED